jgi:hypothetical protein
VRSMETAMETDRDGSGGTYPSRQGAGTETSIPRNSSVAAAELRNSSGNLADSFRVFRWEAFYRRRGVVRRRPWGSQHRGGTTRGWAAPPYGEAGPWPPSGSRSVFGPLPGKIGVL